MSATPKYRTLAIGVTGGIGSGKTDVCAIFESFGATVLHADQIAKELCESVPEIKSRIQQTFGGEIYFPDGTLDRKQVAKLIFNDSSLQQKLEAIVHPAVIEFTGKRIAEEKAKGEIPVLVVEAALHYESGAYKRFDYMIVVDAGEEKRIGRVMQRNKCSRAEVLRRIQAQMPASEKVSRADFVINNNGNRKALEAKCRFVFRLLTTVASNPTAEAMD